VGVGVGFLAFCCSQCVPIKFSLASQNVLQVLIEFPNLFPIAPQIYLIFFALHSTLVTFTMAAQKETTISIWGNVQSLNFLFFIFFVMGQSINDAHHPKKKKKT
jgi:hypothetical protein